MKDLNMSNIPQLSINDIVSKLSKSYCEVIKKGLSVKVLPSVMLWGAPGVGKSQAIRQIKDEIEYNTKKKVNITDVRLLLFNPIDLRGIPTANEDKTLAVWLKPKIFQMDESDKVINILFLDEISAAPQSVQAAAYQITLDRVVGEHKLPDNCIVIAAGNRVTDKSVAFKMPKALANRMLHIEADIDFDSWKSWAIRNNVHPKVVGFLSFRRTHLHKFNSSIDDLAFATPRSWEMVSNILNFVSDDLDEVYPLVSGLVGTGVAMEFRTWCEIYSELPSIKDIFEGKMCKIPKTTDTMYALVASMVSYAKTQTNNLTKIANSIRYAEGFPPDFSVVLMRDYMYLEKDFKMKLMKIPEFVKWLNTKGKLINVSN